MSVVNTNDIKSMMLRCREKSAKLFKRYTDVDLAYSIQQHVNEEDLIAQVIRFFKEESDLYYPAKYIFCNILYSYYAEKYFKLPFYEALQWPELLANSPNEYLYSEHQYVYDTVIKEILPSINQYECSIKKTRLYFKQEFCIFDEDLTLVICK